MSTKIRYKLWSGKFWSDCLSCFSRNLSTDKTLLTKLYGVQFPRYHEQMFLDCILIMEEECEHYITFSQRYGSDVQLLKKGLSTITTGKLPNLIVDFTDAIRPEKN